MNSDNTIEPLIAKRGIKASPSSSSEAKKSAGHSAKPRHRISEHSFFKIEAMNYQESTPRRKRVGKACERCRMKKTKCDGEFPCQRCNDDGLICTASARRRSGHKQLPRGYAEVLENTQLVLIATIRKLYQMVRNGDEWKLGEPRVNERGQAIIHHIAQKLACVRAHSDVDLPVQALIPEDQEGLESLSHLLRRQQTSLDAEKKEHSGADCSSIADGKASDASLSDFPDIERNQHFAFAFGTLDFPQVAELSESCMALKQESDPADQTTETDLSDETISFNTYYDQKNDHDCGPSPSSTSNISISYSDHSTYCTSPILSSFSTANSDTETRLSQGAFMSSTQPNNSYLPWDLPMEIQQSSAALSFMEHLCSQGIDLAAQYQIYQGIASRNGYVEPYAVSSLSGTWAMLGMDDPTIYAG